mmetsp:Transcript_23394/g.53990  ORF Transcript_23394/g.53990 Transcript_23394/m.53990 type:complete len:166 (-) Transcript_23394:74-571(-)
MAALTAYNAVMGLLLVAMGTMDMLAPSCEHAPFTGEDWLCDHTGAFHSLLGWPRLAPSACICGWLMLLLVAIPEPLGVVVTKGLYALMALPVVAMFLSVLVQYISHKPVALALGPSQAIFNGGFVMWYVLAVLYDFDAGEDELSYKTQTSRGSSEPLLNTANGKA